MIFLRNKAIKSYREAFFIGDYSNLLTRKKNLLSKVVVLAFRLFLFLYIYFIIYNILFHFYIKYIIFLIL